jgi:DNA polymerase III delta prime subunit
MIPKNIEHEHVIQAIGEIDRSGIRYHRESVRYNLVYQGKPYPPKYVVSIANKYANGRELEPSEFNSGPETNDFLKALGFNISDSGVGNNYWLDIFTAATWKEFRDAGAHTSGFPEKRQNIVNKVRPGDILLCYVTGLSRWVGALEVVGPSDDNSPIWGSGAYPARVEVRPLILRDPEDGVPLAALEGRVSFFQGPSDRPAYKFFLRSSPKFFKHREDGDAILELLEEGAMPPKKYWVEKTLVKGRADRINGDFALGKALWSPQKGKTGRNIYSAMQDVQPGDIILHLTDNMGFSGVSMAASGADPTFVGLQGTDWKGMPGFLIRLRDYTALDPPLNREEFLGDPAVFAQLALILEQHTGKGLFYNRDHELNQGAYLTEAPVELVGVLNTLYQKKAGRNLPHVDMGPLPQEEAEPVLQPRYTLDDLVEDTGFEKNLVDKWIRSLDRKKQIILQGPPGTGKTYVAERLARLKVSETEGFWEIIQFHPTYAYEDFIQGIHPQIVGGSLSYEIKGGRFFEFCTKASEHVGAPCVLVIDEINRANLSRVFGELMYLLEYRDREIPLAYKGALQIPPNVHIIGTMNTADRSIALVDFALRRRFSFISLKPDYDVLKAHLERDQLPAMSLIRVLEAINKQIKDQNYAIGISFFLKLDLKNTLRDVWEGEIEPYLDEFFYDSLDKVAPFRWERLIAEDAGELNLREWV